MASGDIVERLHDSFLSCPICFQPYNRPKALTCLHTFCEGCIRDYVTSRFDGHGQFPCPLCRQTIYIPVGGVSSFPNNHFIVGLGDTVQGYEHQSRDTCLSLNVQHERSPLLPGASTEHFSPEKPNKLIRRFGEYGTQPHQFIQATGMAVSLFTDDVFVSDCTLNTIAVFSSTGQLRHSFSCDCSVRDVAVTRGGTLLVTVSKAGNSLLREYTVEGRIIANYGTFYSQENPFGIAISRQGNPVVTGIRQNCVHVLTSQYKPSIRFGSKGRGASHFTSPFFVTLSSQDEVIVSDCGNHRIKVHKLDGTFVRAFGKQGTKPGQLFYPMGVCVDKYDNIYVADANNFRVQVFSRDGEPLAVPVKNTYEYGIDVKPVNVVFCKENVLLVLLRGSKFCEIQSYLCDVEKLKPLQKHSWTDLLCCKV
ncbi:tripartite motif-containing protein 2-like [Mya arenaria]|uniref:tripartite motif-containing protein 2-like n=1 Tax=Mya arenaria TaxID=6604 RepID=UPI0022E26F85|nr:tripartite motif-containing protein 2-like [Mya arenaria]